MPLPVMFTFTAELYPEALSIINVSETEVSMILPGATQMSTPSFNKINSSYRSAHICIVSPVDAADLAAA